MKTSEYNRLLKLKNKIKDKTADSKEIKEYMTILHKNGKITDDQFKKYLKSEEADDVLSYALTIGGIILATWLLSKLFDDN